MNFPYPVVYSDDDVTICNIGNVLYVYKFTDYKMPLSGRGTTGWLCCGSWRIKDGEYLQTDGLGRMTGVMVNTYEGLAEFIKQERGHNYEY